MHKAAAGEILLQTAAFAPLGRRRCSMLAIQAVERAHAKGDLVFAADSCSEGLFMLVRGGLRLSVSTAFGGTVIVREPSAPAAIVTAGLLDGGPNCANAIAMSDTVLCVVLREPFLRFCHRNPSVALHLLSEIGAHMRRTSAFIELVTAAGVCQRLARVLLDVMEDAGSPEFPLPCSQAELAGRLGTVRELIYRNLKLLEARQVLHFSGKHIIVTDPAALTSVAGVSSGAAHVFESQAVPPHPACFVLERSKGILNGYSHNGA